MKIQKTFQSALVDNKVLNTNSESKTDTYSCDYIDKMFKFSDWVTIYQNGDNKVRYRHNSFMVEVFIYLPSTYTSEVKLATLPTEVRPNNQVDAQMIGANLNYTHIYKTGEIFVLTQNAWASVTLTYPKNN